MLTDLATTYRVDLELCYDPLEPREVGDRLARISAQKCLLCLGDLARWVVVVVVPDNNAPYLQVQGAG